MANKQKAWRLGAAMFPAGVHGRAHKADATAIGVALRDNPGLLRHVMRNVGEKRLGAAGYEAPRRRTHRMPDLAWGS